MIEIDPDVNSFADDEICWAIERETREIMEFWQHNSIGWAPVDVSKIFANSMLDRQSSLASTLSIWLKGNSEGELILAWANLAALVEGLMKLFLCVYLHDYQKAERVWTKGKKTPDSHMLNNLQSFFAEKVWTPSAPKAKQFSAIPAHARNDGDLNSLSLVRLPPSPFLCDFASDFLRLWASTSASPAPARRRA